MKKILASLIISACSITLNAQDCDLQIQVVTPQAKACGGDQKVADMLATRLVSALNASGVSASKSFGQFYLSGRFDDNYKDAVPGPPASVAVHTTLTLMVADMFDGKVFASQSFDLRGVGTSEQSAYINALSSLTGRNAQLKNFVKSANSTVIKYFDSNYKTLLAKANTAAAKHQYEEALYYSSIIPPCSKGYGEAERLMLSYYQDYIDLEGTRLLQAARHAFAVSPNADGAMEAYALIEKINPASKAWKDATAFADEVKRQTKKEYDFEVHQKYEDAHEVVLRKIDAARQVGVAFGQGQAANTTNILWK